MHGVAFWWTQYCITHAWCWILMDSVLYSPCTVLYFDGLSSEYCIAHAWCWILVDSARFLAKTIRLNNQFNKITDLFYLIVFFLSLFKIHIEGFMLSAIACRPCHWGHKHFVISCVTSIGRLPTSDWGEFTFHLKCTCTWIMSLLYCT